MNTEIVAVEQSTRSAIPQDLNLQIKTSNKTNSINVTNKMTPLKKILLFGIN